MTTPDLSAVRSLLNYSFSPLDLDGYVPAFKEARRANTAKKISGADLSSLPSVSAELVAECICLDPDCRLPEGCPGFPGLTADVLAHIIRHIAAGEIVEGALEETLNALQKKFELFKRLFSEYDEQVKRIGETWDDIIVYALCSIALMLRFQQSGNFNDLNTAIKMNDLILMGPLDVNAGADRLALIALELERRLIVKVGADE